MARQELERTVQQSLLDRLIDDDPDVQRDQPMTWAQSVRQLKASLRRDLDWLLNTRRVAIPAPEELTELGRSLYQFGIPDLSSMDRDSSAVRARLLRIIEQAIADFEPRLAGVSASLAEGSDDSRQRMRFLIEAMLRMDPNPEPVAFDTMLEVSSGEYQLGDAAGA
jgi:type VI secretion system protein ImpF